MGILPKFQKKVWKAMKCAAGPESLQTAPDGAKHSGVMKVKSELQSRPQEDRVASNVQHLSRKAVSNVQTA
jgi:hypothetical protein